MRNLVIASHPDDEVLGCGGTIARLAAEGHEVYIAILGEGISSRYPQREQADPSLLQTLRACCHQVGKLLGAKELFLYNLPDNRFDTVPLLNIVKIIDDLVEKLAPEAIYTQHGGDLNIDHVLVYRATLTAARPIGAGSALSRVPRHTLVFLPVLIGSRHMPAACALGHCRPPGWWSVFFWQSISGIES